MLNTGYTSFLCRGRTNLYDIDILPRNAVHLTIYEAYTIGYTSSLLGI